MSMSPSLFSDITHRILVVYRSFGAGIPLTMGPIGCPETLVSSCLTFQKREGVNYAAAEV
jgi:hypothetical protein